MSRDHGTTRGQDELERVSPLIARYVRWGIRHPQLLTLLWLATTALLFVVSGCCSDRSSR